jgi:hypothetical protein
MIASQHSSQTRYDSLPLRDTPSAVFPSSNTHPSLLNNWPKEAKS